ncbi:2OG-Fe(II) oxygenase family protein [Amylibacter sp. IMCC11727]|uniref:isopenicillin N synthase family dioxygenase n=1 Tax=Amylibacter sp. IMCC11727 TaxID=3039851 RepID=UPI00244E51D0|nr:2OG-Fe(II) oxygenase family protein [Amylibacter sp. IMCC11727]WGI23496.1 2-oxoglutarate and iron-dependent oxygenase domain-containing protein [Amylibacter sp. IMCC11727]
MTDFTKISVIDLSQSDETIVSDFAAAYSTAGFAYIKNHGIPQSLIDATFQASADFHSLPEATKQAIALNENHRGYIPINTSTDVNSKLADVKKPNQSSSFMMMHDSAANPDEYLSGPNQWPNLPNFRDTLTAYTAAMTILGQRLISIAAKACNADPANLAPAFENPTLWLRLLHYPPTPPLSADDLYGSAPHTDFGALTLLAQDGVGGLQVQTPSGDWIDAPKIDGTFVVNVGDMLNRFSNGFLKSTPHRVINRSGRERYSIPFFFDPHVNTTVQPLAGTGDPKFSPLHFGDFLRAELGASYDKHKKADP